MNSKYNGYSFPLRNTVTREKVRFQNRYGIELAGDLYLPRERAKPLAAVAVAGPFGAVKEQCAGLYAEELASRGFAALAFDPSFIGESGGNVRNVASPDINTEDFSAAVDFLSTQDFIDPEKVGILGICGWGGMALNAAAMDTRIKATVTSTMYDMTRISAKGYFDSADSADARYEMKKALNAQRTEDCKNGAYARAGGVVDPLPEDVPFFVKDYYDYQKEGYSNMVFTSNRDPAQWKENFCENDALLCALDRIFDDAVVFTIKGESFRGRKLETVALRTSTGSPADPQQAG